MLREGLVKVNPTRVARCFDVCRPGRIISLFVIRSFRLSSRFLNGTLMRVPYRSGSLAGESCPTTERNHALKLRRFLHADAICLELETKEAPEDDVPDDFAPNGRANINRVRESVLGEIIQLFERTGAVSNPKRLLKELVNREKKSPTAIGNGLAIPHLRTLQVKSFVMAFARSTDGLPFNAPDEEPAHLFFAMLAPPYDDRTYLRVYRNLALILSDPEHLQNFMTARDANEVLRNMELID